MVNGPYATKFKTFVSSKFGYTLKLISEILAASATEVTSKLSRVIGPEKTPVSKNLLLLKNYKKDMKMILRKIIFLILQKDIKL